MKNHLKRIAAPRTWFINRKQNIFIIRPNPGTHSFAFGQPLGLILRDNLKLASSTAEIKRLLNNQEILVDGQRRKDHRFIVGLFDTISIPRLNQSYQIALDAKGRLMAAEIPWEKSLLKTCKVVGKRVLPGGKIQLSLHDGKTLAGENSIKNGDSVVVELPSLNIKKVLPLKNGASVMLVSGRHSGALARLEQVVNEKAVCLSGAEKIETAKKYLFVMG